mgnify:CR=1 FL=1
MYLTTEDIKMSQTYKRKIYRLEHIDDGLHYIAKLAPKELSSLEKMGYALIDEGVNPLGDQEYSYGDLVLLR